MRRGFRRIYVVAKTDALSASKAVALEESLGEDGREPSYRIERIDRAREVGQSYVTSVVTTLRSFVTTAWLVWRYRPRMVVVNGPGTCLPIVVWARMLVPGCRVYYVESIARVDLSPHLLSTTYQQLHLLIFAVPWSFWPRRCGAHDVQGLLQDGDNERDLGRELKGQREREEGSRCTEKSGASHTRKPSEQVRIPSSISPHCLMILFLRAPFLAQEESL